MITNRPLFQSVAFDRTQFSGELPPGWDAELYRNGELVAFRARRRRPISVCRRRARLRRQSLRDPYLRPARAGQKADRDRSTSARGACRPAKPIYWAGVVDPGRDSIERHRGGAPPNPEAGWRAAASIEHGLDKRTSVAALVQTLAVEDRRVTYVEGTVRRSIGPAVTEFGAARDSSGGVAAARSGAGQDRRHQSCLEQLLEPRLRGPAERAVGRQRASLQRRCAVQAGGDTVMPLHGDVRLASRKDGGRTLEANARTSVMLSRFNLATLLRYREERAPGGSATARSRSGTDRQRPDRPGAPARHHRIRDRARPPSCGEPNCRAIGAAAGRPIGKAALAYEGCRTRLRAGGWPMSAGSMPLRSPGRSRRPATARSRPGSISVSRSTAAATGGAPVASRSPRPAASGRSCSATTMATAPRRRRKTGARGDPDRRDPACRPPERQGRLGLGRRTRQFPAGRDRRRHQLAERSQSWSRAIAAQVVVPRPGVSAEVMIPLSGGGAIEGSLLKDGGSAFEGLDLELVDAARQCRRRRTQRLRRLLPVRAGAAGPLSAALDASPAGRRRRRTAPRSDRRRACSPSKRCFGSARRGQGGGADRGR